MTTTPKAEPRDREIARTAPTPQRIAITGPAGLLGRNVLFEFVKRAKDNLESLELVLFGRGAAGVSFEQRIKNIFIEDGFAYLGDHDAEKLSEFLGRQVLYVDTDFSAPDLGIADKDRTALRKLDIDTFYHIASVTDFRDTERAREKLHQTNVQGTHALLALIAEWQVRELCYVSSAYVCGNKSGVIAPDLIDLETNFRNPYERSKLVAEIAVRDFAAKTGTKLRCFRPTTIAGRLIELEIGMTHKFDVFYGFAHFLHRAKREAPPGVDRTIRLVCREGAGLNIVPADFAAKTMIDTVAHDLQGCGFYLANEADTLHTDYISETLEIVDYPDARIVFDLPMDPGPVEAVFFQRVASVLAPYTLAAPMEFDTSNLAGLFADENRRCPPVDREAFGTLMRFAVERDFGRAPA